MRIKLKDSVNVNVSGLMWHTHHPWTFRPLNLHFLINEFIYIVLVFVIKLDRKHRQHNTGHWVAWQDVATQCICDLIWSTSALCVTQALLFF